MSSINVNVNVGRNGWKFDLCIFMMLGGRLLMLTVKAGFMFNFVYVTA